MGDNSDEQRGQVGPLSSLGLVVDLLGATRRARRVDRARQIMSTISAKQIVRDRTTVKASVNFRI